MRLLVIYCHRYNSLRFKIKLQGHQNLMLNKIELIIVSSWPTCSSLVERNKIEIRGLLLKRIWKGKTTLFFVSRQRRDNGIAVSRCLTLEGECHYNRGANNIFKGHHSGTKMKAICPLTSIWAFSLKIWQLRTLFSNWCVKSSRMGEVEDVIICKMPSEGELTWNVKRLKPWF